MKRVDKSVAGLPWSARLLRPRLKSTTGLLLGAMGTMAIGIIFLTMTHAASPLISLQPEDGTASSGATTVTDSTASNGKAVSFPSPATGGSGLVPNGPTGSWTNIFDDEFSGTTLDNTKWANNWFGGNNFNGHPLNSANCTLSGGYATLVLSAPNVGCYFVTNPHNGGGIKGGFEMGINQYVEARIYFPGDSSGHIYNWPAFWTDGQTWPNDGEVDIVEILGGDATSNYHYGSDGNDHPDNSGTVPGNWANAFHTYGLLRESGKNTIYWDGKVIRSYASHDGSAPQYLLLSQGDGGKIVSGSASTIRVDYVRVWKR